MKRTIFKRVTIVVAMLLGAATASAHDFEANGIFYNYKGDGTVSVTFKGSTYDEYANEYTGDVIIPSSVTDSGTTYSVTRVNSYAFSGCSGLTSVTIPNSVNSIGNGVFEGCSGLTSVSIPNSVNSIGNGVFEGCSGLTSVSIPNSVNSIGNSAFYGCSGLTSVSIPNSVNSIGNSAFYGCSGLTSVSIPNSVKSIGYRVFYECSGLTSVSIPNSVTSIGYEAFYGCSGLTSVSIPNSVTSIGNGAFSGCWGLTRVDISSIETWLKIEFEDSSSNPLYYARHLYLNGEEVKDLVIPNFVTSIGDMAFFGCSGLTSVSIPNSVTSIGKSAFTNCSSLTRVDISSIEIWLGIKFADYDSNPLSYAHHLYLNGEEVKDLVIPNSVTSIGYYAFRGCSGLTSVTIPNSVTSIGYGAFAFCSGLTSVTIPKSVKSIGNSAFDSCSGLTTVTIPNSVTSIGSDAFSRCSGLTSVSIPNSVTSIGDAAFSGCSGLTSVSIPNSVNSIGDGAFWDCIGLTSVNIPNSVSSIGMYAFFGCSGLTSVNIPNSVSSIGGCAFSGCSGLKTIFYNAENCAVAASNAFTTSNLNIIIGKDVKKVPNYLFNSLAPKRVISQSVNPPTCGENTFNSDAYTEILYVPSDAVFSYQFADVWSKFASINGIDKPITGITLSESDVTLKVNQTKTITATITPADATIPDAYYWTSSKSGVATVDDNGKVTAVAEGTAVISAISCDGGDIIATCNVTVKSNKATSITLNATELKIAKNATATLTYTILPEDAEVKTAKWIVSDASVLIYRVKDDGSILIGGKSEGTATVTARTTDGSNLEAICVVTVYPVAANVNQLKPGTNRVNFGLQGVKMHNGVLYACTTAESVNKSTPTLHGNAPDNMDTYEDRNFDEFAQRDWVAISGLVDGFVGKELSYPFVATYADGLLTPSGTITTIATTAYTLNTFRAENILHGGYSNYAEGVYKAYYVPARVNEVAYFMGLIENVGGVKYLYSNNAYGRKDGEGIKIEGNIADNLESYSLMEGILVADATTKAGVKIIMLQDLGKATGVEGVDTAAARIYSANGNIIIAATEDGVAAVYDFTGRLIKSVPVASGDSTAVPVMPGCYIVRTGVKTQSVVVK